MTAEKEGIIRDRLNSELYQRDLTAVTTLPLPWSSLSGKTILISGATGMIGSTLIDVLMKQNLEMALNCHVIALGRNEAKAKNRFGSYWEDPFFCFAQCDLTDAEGLRSAVADGTGQTTPLHYIFHSASVTHPVAYVADPIGTILTSITGLKNLLDLAVEHSCERFLFASSNEIYGENRGDVELFDEKYCGYLDCNTLRAGYPEGKRAGEALCQAYIRQKGLDVVIPRFTRSFGPTLLPTDTKALSQFLHKGIAREDIVLKSAGTQFYSYTYVCDAVSGLLFCMLKGTCGEAYNIADAGGNITLRGLAGMIAAYAGTKVVFEIPDAAEAAGYSRATKALLDGTKLKQLGWRMQFDLKTALVHTMDILSLDGTDR